MSHEYRSLATSTDSTATQSMSSSKYSFAVFTEIPDSYDVTIDSVVTCRLYYAKIFSEEDVIIVCKVTDKMRPVLSMVLEWIPEDKINSYCHRSLRLDLKEVLDQLSEDEFYQYLYLRRRIGEEEVITASVPFRFKKTGRKNFLVLRSKEHILREKTGKFAEMKEQMQTGSEELRRELFEKERQLEEVVRNKDQLLEKKAKFLVVIDQLRDDNQAISGQLSDCLVRSEELDKQLAGIKSERQVMDEKIREQKQKLSRLESKKERQEEELKLLRECVHGYEQNLIRRLGMIKD